MNLQINFFSKFCKENCLVQFFIFFLIIIIPQLIFYQDLWDGTIYNYAQEINNFNGAKLHLYEFGWVLNYWFIFFLIKISNFLSIDYYFFCLALLSIFYYFFLYECKLFIFNYVSKNEIFISRAIFLISLFSIQSYYYSSIFVWHIFCQFSILFGLRNYYSKNFSKVFFSFFFLFIAFSFKSSILFILTIALYYQKKNFLNFKYYFLMVFGILVFIFFHFFLQNSGRAENYAQILNFLDFRNLALIIKSFLSYMTFFIPISLIILICIFKSFYLKKRLDLNILKYFILENKFLFLLIISSIIPYMAIGRGNVIWDVEDWSGRNSILIIIPVSLISLCILNLFLKINIISKKFVTISFIFLLLVNFSLLSKGILFKLNRIIYQKELSDAVIKNQNLLKNQKGILVIEDTYQPSPSFRIMELNYLIFKAIGINNLWTTFQKEYNKTIINYPDNDKYKYVYVSNFYSNKNIDENCILIFKFKTSGFSNLPDKILNLITEKNYDVKIQKINLINCKK